MSSTSHSSFTMNGQNGNYDGTAPLRFNNVIPRQNVFAHNNNAGFYQSNSALRSRGVPAGQLPPGQKRYGGNGAYGSPRSTPYRNRPFDEYDSDEYSDPLDNAHPYSRPRPQQSARAAGKQPRRSRSANQVQPIQRNLQGAWNGPSIPLQALSPGPDLQRSQSVQSVNSAYYNEAIEIMNENAVGRMDNQAHEVGSSPTLGMPRNLSEDGTPRRPSRTNTKMSLPTRKRSSAQILEGKMPKIFRANVPAADEVADLEANKGHQQSRFGWRPDAKHSMEYVYDQLSKRLEAKNLIVAGIAEFIGTFLFLFFALAINTTVANVKDQEKARGATGTDLTALLVSSLGFGFSLVISAWVFFRVSGGVQNPAITLALTIVGSLDWKRCIILSFFQYLGGIAASGLISGLYPGNINSRTTLGDGVSVNQGFWFEFFLSIELIFTVLMLACEKHRATYLAPVGIGLALFNTQLLGQPYTGASVNPARTLGPDVAQHTFSGYCWIYYIAPYFAAIVSAGFYLGLKWIRYETTSPDQDADEQGSGLKKQVIIDGQGNIIGTIDEVHAEEYDVKEIEENEKGEMTIVGGGDEVNDSSQSMDPTSSYNQHPPAEYGTATVFPDHNQVQVPQQAEQSGIEPRSSSLHQMPAAGSGGHPLAGPHGGGTSLPYINSAQNPRH